MKRYIMILVMTMAISSVTLGYEYSDYTWHTYNGHQYALTLDYSDWAQAEEWAVEVGGHLVTINDSDENDWLAEFIKDSYCRSIFEPGHNLAWIGLQKLDAELEWANGEPVTYTNFYYHWLIDYQHWYMHGNSHWDYPGRGQWNSNPLHDTEYDHQPRGIIEISRLQATVDIDPDTLNLKSKGKWITCYIELPEGYDVGDIDVSTIKLHDSIPAEAEPTAIGDYDSDGIADLMVKFDMSAVQGILQVGEVQVTVTGELNDGTPFEGSDTIRVINP